MTPGAMAGFTAAYLRLGDIANVLTILRGRTQGFKPGKIRRS